MATIVVKPNLKQLKVKIIVPRIFTMRMKLGFVFIRLGVFIAGMGLKSELDSSEWNPDARVNG